MIGSHRVALSMALMLLVSRVGAAVLDGDAAVARNLRGRIVRLQGDQMTFRGDEGEELRITMRRPYKVYDRVPSDLSHVTSSGYVGVTSVRQVDGTERATEIHIFPEEMRGAGEGSRMITLTESASAAPAGRMTNGTVASTQARMSSGTARMTNGAARMSNGAAKAVGNRLVVSFNGGSQTITVPADVSVTEIRVVSHPVAVGDRAFVTVVKGADGYTSDRLTLIH